MGKEMMEGRRLANSIFSFLWGSLDIFIADGDGVGVETGQRHD